MGEISRLLLLYTNIFNQFTFLLPLRLTRRECLGPWRQSCSQKKGARACWEKRQKESIDAGFITERNYLASYPVARMRRSRRAQVDAAAAMLIPVQMSPTVVIRVCEHLRSNSEIMKIPSPIASRKPYAGASI